VGRIDEKQQEDAEAAKRRKGPPPPTIPELTTMGAELDDGDLGADDMFKDIK
jgi:hypothetical protein